MLPEQKKAGAKIKRRTRMFSDVETPHVSSGGWLYCAVQLRVAR